MKSVINRACCALILSSSIILSGCSKEEPAPVTEPQPSHFIEKGKSIVKGLGACGVCHGKSISPGAVLSGGREQEDRYGSVAAANLTPAKTGLSGWSTMELIYLFRSGTNREGNKISRAVHKGYEWISDNDLLAIIAYLRSLAPVENEVDRRSVSFIERNTTGIMEGDADVTGYVPEIDKSYALEFGRYLVDHVARCGYCHNTEGGVLGEEIYLGGGETIRNEHGEKIAPNITSSDQVGLGNWSEDEIVHYLQSGEAPGNRASDPNFCPVEFFKNTPPEDLYAVAKYLKTVPAQY